MRRAAKRQATDHLLMIRPAVFYANPQTIGSNAFQKEGGRTVTRAAQAEFDRMVRLLRETGVRVDVLNGSADCPDHVFPDWFATLEGKALHLFSLLAPNRRAERGAAMLAHLEGLGYRLALDLRPFEAVGVHLEAMGSLVLDRVNGVAYLVRSIRSNVGLARRWCAAAGYELVALEARESVYHTDVALFVCTEVAGACFEAIEEPGRSELRRRLAASHRHGVIELSGEQMRSFCGNCIEVVCPDGTRCLVMSTRAFDALTLGQKQVLRRGVHRLLHCDLRTIEEHGGGSARCMCGELF